MQNRNRLIVLGLLGGALWGMVAWLFIAMPLFIIELLPVLIPISVFAFLLFVIGLLLLTIVATAVVRLMAPRYAWTVILMAASLIVLYNLSPLAPAWKCYGKRLYVATVNAAGQNCTTTCTNNKKKPCGGWSSCWDKDISCSSAGRDQDGRPCQGCCFSCTVVCEDPDPPSPPAQPPSISGTVDCSQAGSSGWCVGNSTLNLTASDPQNYTLTISGTIDGSAFTCPAGNTCSVALPEGNGPITYKATAATSGLSSSTGSTTWRRDVTAPSSNAVFPSPNGSNGWHITSPISVSANGSDSLSGLANAQVSINGGVWQSNASLTDGTYAVDFRAVDNAGNLTTISRSIQVDATPPLVNPVIPSPDGLNAWFVTAPVDVSVNGSDSGSGLANAQLSVDAGALQPGASLSDGVHTINFTSTDIAGNTATVTKTVKVDTGLPTIATSSFGTSGNSGWYISQTTTTISASDFSGIDQIEYNQNGGGWQNGSSVISNDGVNQIAIRVQDIAGNVASSSVEVKVDTVAPSLSHWISATSGMAGWYISPVTTKISSSDETSGVDRIEYNQNSAGWQNGSSVLSNDGVDAIDLRVFDVAGNLSTDSVQVKVDTEKPTSKFTTPENGSANTVLRGMDSLFGSSSDMISGVSSAEISMDGRNWIPLVLDSNDMWTYDWNTTSWPDGVYPVVVRTTDVAGNQELVESAAHITLLVNNAPPHIKLTPEWFVWESGSLLIKTEYFPVRDGMIVISDPGKRWPSIRIPFGQKYPAEIRWDRRFANGVPAPSGTYRVTVSACNMYDLCAEKSATIKIPWIVAVHPSVPVPTMMVEVEQEATPEVKEPSETPVAPAVEASSAGIEIRTQSKAGHKPAPSILSFVVIVALMWAVASAALADKRPKAIHAIAKSISQRHKGDF